jgi:diguanylate cyclase (GGDEF)-like protein
MSSPREHTHLPEALFEIGKAIGLDDDLDALLGRISQLVCDLVGAEACSFMLLDGTRTRLVGRAAYGLSRSDVRTISFRIGTGVAGWVVQHGEPALVEEVRDDPRFAELPGSSRRIRSLACVPLQAGGATIGALTTTSSQPAAFNSDDVELLGLVARTIALDVENKRLRRLSVTDPLTGAYNREFLAQYLPKATKDCSDRGRPLSVAMIDVDHFKAVNDRFGHDIGDRVLAEVARRLRNATREEDLVVRYGGEEFLVLFPCSEVETAKQVAERMRERLAGQPFVIDDASLQVKVSIGVAQMRTSESSDLLLRRADHAMYRAKENGRDRVEVAS